MLLPTFVLGILVAAGMLGLPTFGRNYCQAANKDYNRKYAVFVAIDKYDRKYFRSFSNCVYDCKTLKNTLIRDYGYTDDHIVEFYDPKAKSDDILAKLKELATICKDGDSLLFVFSGHGTFAPRTADDSDERVASCLVCSDDPSTNKHLLRSSDLVKAAEAIPCKHKLFILDACYSGGFLLDAKVPDNPEIQEEQDSFLDNYKYKGFWLLAAGDFQGVNSQFGQRSHSLFISALLQQLRDRCDSRREDQAFGIRRLAANVQAAVEANVSAKGQRVESGALGSFSGEFIFRPSRPVITPARIQQLKEYAASLRQIDLAVQAGDGRLADSLVKEADRRFVGIDAERPFEWNLALARVRNLPRSLDLPAAGTNAVAFTPDGKRLFVIQRTGILHTCSLDRPNGKLIQEGKIQLALGQPIQVFALKHLAKAGRDLLLCVHGPALKPGEAPNRELSLVLIDPNNSRITPLRKFTAAWADLAVYEHSKPPVIAIHHTAKPYAPNPRPAALDVVSLDGDLKWTTTIKSTSLHAPVLAPRYGDRPQPQFSAPPPGDTWSLYLPQLDNNNDVIVEYGVKGEVRSSIDVGSSCRGMTVTDDGGIVAIAREGAGFYCDILIYVRERSAWRTRGRDVLRRHHDTVVDLQFENRGRDLRLVSLDTQGLLCIWTVGSGKLESAVSAQKGLAGRVHIDDSGKNVAILVVGNSGLNLNLIELPRQHQYSLKAQGLPDGEYTLIQLASKRKVCLLSDQTIAIFSTAGRKLDLQERARYKYLLAAAVCRDERSICAIATDELPDAFNPQKSNNCHLVEIDTKSLKVLSDVVCPDAVDVCAGFGEDDYVVTRWCTEERPERTRNEALYKRQHLFGERTTGNTELVRFRAGRIEKYSTVKALVTKAMCRNDDTLLLVGFVNKPKYQRAGFLRLFRHGQEKDEAFLAVRDGASIAGLAFGENQTRLICGWTDGGVSFFDLQDINDPRESRIRGQTTMRSLSVSTNKTRFLTCCFNGDLEVWDMVTGENLVNLGSDTRLFDATLCEPEKVLVISRSGTVEYLEAR